MLKLDRLDTLFVVWSFTVQIILIVHFALRKWGPAEYLEKFAWLVYALAIPAVVISAVLLRGGKDWGLWLGGFIFLVFAAYGYWIEYIQKIKWRTPINWRVGGPYVTLYLATVMFYWWPVGGISRPLWYVYAVLFLVATYLNITSH
jgi:hypothetical protein